MTTRKLRWSAALFAVVIWTARACPPAVASEQRPNVVVILTDDQGWGDLSVHGNVNLQTPRIDSLARDGALLEWFYVCPLCSPTRAEFLTGRYYLRGGVRGVTSGAERLNLDEKTIGETFKAAGYATAAFGKWHNGSQYPYHPNARGFDEFYGFCSGHWGQYFDPLLEHNGRPVRGKGFVIDDFTDHALEFIEKNKDRPFFCYLPYNTPHSPFQVPDRFYAKFQNLPIAMRYHGPEKEELDKTRCVLAMCENIDWNVGRVLGKLDELGIANSTIVVYFSDNGPNTWRWNGGMKGRKGSTDEGGVRVPCLVRWPGQIRPGTRVPQIAAAIDLLPTLADMAGIPIVGDKTLDGVSIKPLLLGTAGDWPDRMIFSCQGSAVSVRTQQYRLDRGGRLIDVAADPGQQRDISAQRPEIAARLVRAVARWKAELPPATAADNRPFPVGHGEFPVAYLPARDGAATGKVRRSSSAPNCSFFTNWVSADDRITWDIEVATGGNYEAVVYYTCPKEDVGAAVELSFGAASVQGRVTEPQDPPLVGAEFDRVLRQGESYVKDFRPLRLGSFRLEKGRGLLSLRALDVPHRQVMDVRAVALTLLKGKVTVHGSGTGPFFSGKTSHAQKPSAEKWTCPLPHREGDSPVFAAKMQVGGATSAVPRKRGQSPVNGGRGGQPPNILWITCEDICPNLGCYGDSYAETPHLDRFAANGLRYLNVWSNAPVCAPARTAIITGVYPTSTGAHHMRSLVAMPPMMKMFPQMLRERGYYCTNNLKEDYNLQKPGQVWDDSSKKAHWKNRQPGQPFFAVFNIETSHESQIRRRPHTLKHDPAKVRVPAYHPDTPEVRRDWAQYYDKITEMDAQAEARLSELEEAGLTGETVVFFFGDNGCGMPRSKRWPYNSGLHVPLIVHVPEKFSRLAPKEYAAGGASDRLVAFVDLAPTLLSLAGIEPPAWIEGHAFLGEHPAPPQPYLYGFRGRMDERYDMIRSVRNGRYVYIRNYMPHLIYGQHIDYMFQMPTAQVWKRLFDEGELSPPQTCFWEPKPAEELYDLHADPDEVHNLVASPQHQAVLEELREAHKEHVLKTRDVGFLSEAEQHRCAAGTTMYELGHDARKYPLEKILAMAELAAARHPEALPQLQQGIKDDQGGVRYWAAMGLLIRGRSAVGAAREDLRMALDDPSPSVRVAAASALGQHGDDDDLARALQVLKELAPADKNGLYVSALVLNAIDMLGPKAASLTTFLRTITIKDPAAPPRASECLPRLLERISSGQGRTPATL